MLYFRSKLLIIYSVTEGWFPCFSSTIAKVLISNFLFMHHAYWAYDRKALVYICRHVSCGFDHRLSGLQAETACRTGCQGCIQAESAGRDANPVASTAEKIDWKWRTGRTLNLKRETVIYDVKDGKLEHPLRRVPQGEEDITIEDEACEEQAAAWALENNRHAGTGTDHFKQAKRQYLAIRVNSTVYGVVGIMIQKQPLDAFENSVLLSILGECALALENDKNVRKRRGSDPGKE